MSAGRPSGFQDSIDVVQVIAGVDRLGLCGRLPSIGEHHHAAPAIVVGMDGPIQFVGEGGSHRTRGALIAPGFSHAVVAGGGRVAVFLLPPQNARVGGAPVRDLTRPGAWVSLGQSILAKKLSGFDPVDDCLRLEGLDLRPIDPRLRLVVDALAATLDQNVRVAELASVARLSPSRLMYLAHDQLGTSLRRYRRWLRSFRVTRAFASGGTLTEAALSAGFASSAHLSSTAREHFGIRPSDILAPRRRSEIRAL